MPNKVFGIKEKDFFQFIKKINQFNETHDSFSTQTHYVPDTITSQAGTWHAIIYYSPSISSSKPAKAQPQPNLPLKTPISKPDWRTKPASKETWNLLHKRFKDRMFSPDLTQGQADDILKGRKK